MTTAEAMRKLRQAFINLGKAMIEPIEPALIKILDFIKRFTG